MSNINTRWPAEPVAGKQLSQAPYANETTHTIARFMPNYYGTDALSVIFPIGRLTDPVIGQNLLIPSVFAWGMVAIGIQAFQRRAYQNEEEK